MYFLQAICIILIFTFVVLSATEFLNQFNLSFRFLSGRNILSFVGIILLGVVVFNLTSLTSLWAQRLYSIAILGLCLSYLIILLPMGKLCFHAKKAPWFFLWIGWFFNALLIFSLLGGSCCEVNEVLAESVFIVLAMGLLWHKMHNIKS
ncbi:MAG: hypothetical protein ACLFP2_06250 [Candidatus Woesearchaeota archaeon]